VLEIKLFLVDKTGSGFTFADWLINYQDGGFKRRGLCGSILFFCKILQVLGCCIGYLHYNLFVSLSFWRMLFTYSWQKISFRYFTIFICPLGFYFI